MYKSLYKLESRPFELYPDPAFLWLEGKYKEAFSVLQDGILDNMGFVLLTGIAGTGKTTLVDSLTRELRGDVIWSVISGPSLDRIDFFNKIGTGFGIGKNFISKVQFLIQFSHFLYEIHDQGKKVVLFVDDCHLLRQEMFEELYLLSNIEKADARLLDIFLVGHPEFNEMLFRPENNAVRRRLGLKAGLVPLGRNETVDYIRHRLKISGTVEKIFTARAFQVIHQYSQGVPRFIHMICEKALQAAFLKGEKTIDHKLIFQCVQKLKLPVPPEQGDIKLPPAEKNPVEKDQEKCVPRAFDSQAHKGLISRKRKKWARFYGALFLLVCIGMGSSFVLLKKEVPVVAETAVPAAAEDDGAGGAQDTEVASAPEDFALPVAPVLQNNNDTLPDARESEIKGLILKEKIFPPLDREKIVLGLQPGSVKLTVDAERVFAEFIEILLQYPDARVLVKGFVSSDNDSAENTRLSEERATSVQQLLIQHGIAETQIEVRGMGIKDPIAGNDTPNGRFKNRRVEIEVIDDGV